jgi:hypothetical protein
MDFAFLVDRVHVYGIVPHYALAVPFSILMLIKRGSQIQMRHRSSDRRGRVDRPRIMRQANSEIDPELCPRQPPPPSSTIATSRLLTADYAAKCGKKWLTHARHGPLAPTVAA